MADKTKTWLLTWNTAEHRWDETEYGEAVRQTREYTSCGGLWPCAGGRPEVGDRFYLVMFGQERNNGIIASGTVAGSSCSGSGRGDRIGVNFECMLDHRKEAALSIESLNSMFPDQEWTPVKSGISIKPEYTEALSELWVNHTKDIISANEQPAIRVAKKSDWNTHEMPEQHETFDIHRPLTEEEMGILRRGNIPLEMEDKWFWYMEGDTLFAHRSWTGFCIYIVTFDGPTLHVTVNRDPEQYRCTDIQEDIRELNDLLSWWTEPDYDHYGQWLSEICRALEKN